MNTQETCTKKTQRQWTQSCLPILPIQLLIIWMSLMLEYFSQNGDWHRYIIKRVPAIPQHRILNFTGESSIAILIGISTWLNGCTLHAKGINTLVKDTVQYRTLSLISVFQRIEIRSLLNWVMSKRWKKSSLTISWSRTPSWHVNVTCHCCGGKDPPKATVISPQRSCEMQKTSGYCQKSQIKSLLWQRCQLWPSKLMGRWSLNY